MRSETWGLFMRANYQDGLKLGDINSCLSGTALILQVPIAYNREDLETLTILQGIGISQFGDNLHEYVILKESDFPVKNPRFHYTWDLECMVRGATKQLTKQRLARKAA